MDMLDYCKWRGDITFDVDPFNYIDNLIFAYFSYLNFDELFKNNEIYTIKQLSNLYDVDKSNASFLQTIAKTKRYSNLKVHDYVSILRPDKIEQFAAVTIDLPGFTSIISYRGTDTTLVGWNEDFRLSYEEIPAQRDAIEYMNKCTKIFRKYIVLGHSKGGNLALYASVNCKKNVQNRIIKIISNDGPGLFEGTYNIEDYNNIKNRYIKIIPGASLFGLLFTNSEKRMIVKSSASGLGQHAIETWQVEANHLIELDDTDENSKLTKKAFDNFLAKSTEEARKVFIKEYFGKLKQADINTINDFASGDINRMLVVLKNINDVNKVAKDTMGILMKCFIDEFGNNIIKNVSKTVSDIKDEAVKHLDKVTSAIKK